MTLFLVILMFLLLPSVPALWIAHRLTHPGRKHRPGQCRQCQYDRSSLPHTTPCPECGTTEPPTPGRVHRTVPARWSRKTIALLSFLAFSPYLLIIIRFGTPADTATKLLAAVTIGAALQTLALLWFAARFASAMHAIGAAIVLLAPPLVHGIAACVFAEYTTRSQDVGHVEFSLALLGWSLATSILCFCILCLPLLLSRGHHPPGPTP